MGFVNYEKLNEDIIFTEELWNKRDLNADEKMFLINQLVGRINKGKENQKFSDLMQNNMSGGLMKSMLKRLVKHDEGDKDE